MTTEKIQKKTNAKTGKPKVSTRGGARKGAGRPKGSTDKVTVQGLLTALEVKSNQSYEEILIEDFLQARDTDRALAYKYHNLLTNKLLATLNTLEVTGSEDAVAQKQAAFAEAIAQITGINTKS